MLETEKEVFTKSELIQVIESVKLKIQELDNLIGSGIRVHEISSGYSCNRLEFVNGQEYRIIIDKIIK